jgi:hypothetical protein
VSTSLASASSADLHLTSAKLFAAHRSQAAKVGRCRDAVPVDLTALLTTFGPTTQEGECSMANGEINVDETATTGERLAPAGTELFADWAARMQRGRGRHAAISRNLNTWSNYKNWSERVRQSWESDVSSKPKK